MATLGTLFFSLIEQLVDSIGTCERIKETPMVFGYVATLRSFLMLWLVTLPLALIGEYGWPTDEEKRADFLFAAEEIPNVVGTPTRSPSS